MYLNLDTIKRHLNIDSGFTDDDEYLQMLEGVAFDVIERHIDHQLNDLLVDGALPKPIQQAALLYIGNLYQSRESIAFTNAIEIPFAYDYILSLYKDYSKREENGGTF